MAFVMHTLSPEELVSFTSMVFSSPIARTIKDELGKGGLSALSALRESLSEKFSYWLKNTISSNASANEQQSAIQADLQQNPSHVDELQTFLKNFAQEQHQLFEKLKLSFEVELQKQSSNRHYDFSGAKIGVFIENLTGTMTLHQNF